MAVRARIEFEGIVQGVGFRPFLHKLAQGMGLNGWALNSSAGVLMELEGTKELLEEYVSRVREEGPPLSRVLIAKVRILPYLGIEGFTIRPSVTDETELTLLCPDVATCPDCISEILNPSDRRHSYAFTNCTNCGPRYTIVRSLPYDRPQTTMAGFPLCKECEAEYKDVSDRRYHAQPVACPECGPRLWFEDKAHNEIDANPLAETAQRLLANQIVAIKGLGGFHLACLAKSDGAVLQLRKRKARSFFKPLAVMVPNIEVAHALCQIDHVAEEWLTSTTAPVVLLPLKDGEGAQLVSRYVSPQLDRVGLMLPYTPLHHLLLAAVGKPLVMTSGNLSDEPIVHQNETARTSLGKLADGWLMHDRPIHSRCDDSVLAAGSDGSFTVLRHSRGFSPFPITLPKDGPAVLALGGDIKTTFAASRGHFVFLSPHLGDGEQLGTYAFFRETWEHYRRLFHLEPEAVACDKHPGYHTGRWASELASELGVPLVRAQHHHAHLVSLQAERGLAGKHVAVVADGTGYGDDHTLWGGEILYGDATGYERLSHLQPIMLPGGENAVREPWRIAMSLIHSAAPHLLENYIEQLTSGELTDKVQAELPQRIPDGVNPSFKSPIPKDATLTKSMLHSKAALVPSSSLGRLFDGVAALLGITINSTYEGQAPMELEAVARRGDETVLAQEWYQPGVVMRWDSLIIGLLESNLPVADAALAFHRWCARMFALQAITAAKERGLNTVLASGGCMQNMLLLGHLRDECLVAEMDLVTHREVPAGDGGLALGTLRISQEALNVITHYG